MTALTKESRLFRCVTPERSLCRSLVVVWLLFGCFPDASASPAPGTSPSFYAIYDRIADLESLGVKEIHNALFSKDATTAVVYGRHHDGRMALFTLSTTGSDLQKIKLPENVDALWEGTISSDGKRVFFRHHWDKAVYKLEAGKVTKIFDADDFAQVTNIDQIQTTGDGQWLYFREPRHSIWRISHTGSTPQRLIQEKHVPHTKGVNANISQFRISADGSLVVFIVDGYWDPRGAYRQDQQIYAWTNGRTWPLTKDPGNVFKTHLAVSGNGAFVGYSAAAPINKLRIVSTGSGEIKDLETIGHVGGMVMNTDGSMSFYYDQAYNGGRMAYTDGRPTIDLFPAYNVNAIALNSPWSLAMDATGKRIGFRTGEGVYTGYLAGPAEVSGAPVIQQMSLEPPVDSAATAQQGTTLRAQVTDPDGLQDIIRTSTNILNEGRSDNDIRRLSVYFHRPANDSGHPPDATKGDGVFASHGAPGGKPERFENNSIRMAVMDRSGTVVLADIPLTGTPVQNFDTATQDNGETDNIGTQVAGSAGASADKESPGPPATSGTPKGPSPWRPSTTTYLAACEGHCQEAGIIRNTHGGAFTMYVNPAIDDEIAQWGDCLQSVTQCVEDKRGAVKSCVASAQCPERCRDDFAHRATNESNDERLIEIFEAVFIHENAPCYPRDGVPPA